MINTNDLVNVIRACLYSISRGKEDKETLPNKELDESIKKVNNALSGKEKLPVLEDNNKPNEDDKIDKKIKVEDSSVTKSDNPSHDDVSNIDTDDFDVEQFKKDIRKFFDDTFGIDITK